MSASHSEPAWSTSLSLAVGLHVAFAVSFLLPMYAQEEPPLMLVPIVPLWVVLEGLIGFTTYTAQLTRSGSKRGERKALFTILIAWLPLPALFLFYLLAGK